MTLLAVLLPVVLAATAAAPGATAADRCFRSGDFRGFTPVDDHRFHIRLRNREVWRVETRGACPQLLFPMARLGLATKSTGLICGPVDWDLTVGQAGSRIAAPCIVESLTPLTPAEAAALPRRQRP